MIRIILFFNILYLLYNRKTDFYLVYCLRDFHRYVLDYYPF